MAKTPPYFRDGEEITREYFLELDSTGRIASMRDWFFDMYEDPAQETPFNSREGGYQYIWGGPFDAQEELYGNFGDTASEEEIQTAVELIEENGMTDWAPRHTEPEDEPGVDEDYNESPVRFPSHEEMEALKQQTLASFDRVEQLLDQERGRLLRMHNMPPELVESDPPVPEDVQKAIREQIAETRNLVDSPTPDQVALIEKVSIFRRIGNLLRHPFAIGIGGAMAGGPLGNAGQFVWDQTGGQVIAHRQEIVEALTQAADAIWAWAQHLLPF